jgi:WD40 repeat protein
MKVAHATAVLTAVLAFLPGCGPPRTREPRADVSLGASPVSALALAGGADQVFAGTQQGSIEEWDLVRAVRLRSFEGHTAPVRGLAVHGGRLASAGADGSVRVWVLAGGPPRVAAGLAGPSAVAFDPGGALWIGGERGVLSWDVGGAAPRPLPEGGGPVRAMAVSADGRWLATGGPAGALVVHALPGGGVAHRVTAAGPARDRVEALALSPDGTTLALGTSGGTLELWDVVRGTRRHSLEGHRRITRSRGWIHALAFAPDGRTLASGGGDGLVRVWSAEDGRLRRTLATGSGVARLWSTDSYLYPEALAFAPDGSLVSGHSRGRLRLWAPGF